MDLIPPSVVEGYDVSHLHALATHMTKSVADREELMGTVNELAAGQSWVGAGREGQAVPLAEHNAQAMTAGAALIATAGIATAGAGSLYSLKQELVAGLNAAKVAQLQVDDEYNVIDPFAGTPVGTVRASAVQALQAQLKTGAQAFTATEHTTAQAIHAAMQPTGKPDAENTRNGHVSMMDNHFKTGGGDDPTEPPMPSVGGEPNEDMLISTQSGAASTQSGLGEEDTRLPAMPKVWPPVEPVPPTPPAKCGPLEFAKDTFNVTAADAGTTAAGLLFPLEGPLMIPSAIAIAKGLETVAETSGTEIDCIERGIG